MRTISGGTRTCTRIIDAHCHIFPDAIARRAVESVDGFYDNPPGEHWDGTAATLVKSGGAAGISHFVVHSVATRPGQVSHINRFIAGAAAQSNGAFTGLGAMHPASDDLERDFEELVSLGLKGVKLHPDFQRFHVDDPRAMRIFEMCADAGLPVCVHTGDSRYDYSNPLRVARVLQALPGLKFIGAHLGGWSVWEEAARVLAGYGNLYVDTSSSFYALAPDRALAILRAYGSRRVMFGTDYPMWPQRPELGYLARLGLTDREYEDILWRTCAGLFDIPFPQRQGEDIQ